MKQNMKRVLLVLCMVTCLFSLSACSGGASDVAKSTLDENTAASISQISESLLQQISSFTGAEAAEVEAGLRKEKQTVLADGIASWVAIEKEAGSLVGISSSIANEAEEGYVCSVNADFSNRKVEFKIFFSMEGQNLEPTSIAFTPEYSMGERLTKAGMNTLMGMGTVFMVLILISCLIACFKYIGVFEQKMKNKQIAEVPVAIPTPEPASVVEEELVDDLELVAVITAAIAASDGVSPEGLVVRSIRRAPGAKWKRA